MHKPACQLVPNEADCDVQLPSPQLGSSVVAVQRVDVGKAKKRDDTAPQCPEPLGLFSKKTPLAPTRADVKGNLKRRAEFSFTSHLCQTYEACELFPNSKQNQCLFRANRPFTLGG